MNNSIYYKRAEQIRIIMQSIGTKHPYTDVVLVVEDKSCEIIAKHLVHLLGQQLQLYLAMDTYSVRHTAKAA